MHYENESVVAAGDGTRLFYGTRGQGHDMFMCDGIACDGFAWTYLQPHFSKTHRVTHWHYRGHGKSGQPCDATRITTSDFAKDLLKVVDSVTDKPIVLCGHSMGTQVALEFYRLAPEKIKALVLINGSYGQLTSTFHDTDILEKALPYLIKLTQRFPQFTRAAWSKVPTKLAYLVARYTGEIDGGAIGEEDFARYIEHVTSMDPLLFLAMLRKAGDHTAEDILKNIQVPTLVIASELDTFTPPSQAKKLAQAIPNADYFLVRGGSHAAPVEQPATMQLRIEKFLRERVHQRETISPIQNTKPQKRSKKDQSKKDSKENHA